MMALAARAAALAVLGMVAGFILNTLRPDGVALNAPPPAGACQAPGLGDAVERLTPEQANRLCGDPGVLVADARPSELFAAGHIAGALHLPCAAPGDVASAVPQLLAGRHTVVVYGQDTVEAVAVADGLRRRHSAGALRVAVIEGGFAAWDRAGLACASGPCPECGEAGHDHAGPSEGTP